MVFITKFIWAFFCFCWALRLCVHALTFSSCIYVNQKKKKDFPFSFSFFLFLADVFIHTNLQKFYILKTYGMGSPKYVKTRFLKTRAKSTTSDSLIGLTTPSHSHCLLLSTFLDNLLAMSMVKPSMSLSLVNNCKAVAEYAGLETSLLRSIRASRISKVLQKKKEKENAHYDINNITQIKENATFSFCEKQTVENPMKRNADSNFVIYLSLKTSGDSGASPASFFTVRDTETRGDLGSTATSSMSISDTNACKISIRKFVLFNSLWCARISNPDIPDEAKKASKTMVLLRSFNPWKEN